jgi:glycerol kinase
MQRIENSLPVSLLELWTIDELNRKWRIDRSFYEKMSPLEVKSLKQHWLKAMEKAKNWAE